MHLWCWTPDSCWAPPRACPWSPPSAESRLASASVTAPRRRLGARLLHPAQPEDHLGIQLRLEAGLPIAFDHPLAVDFQHPAGRETTHQCLAHLGEVHARL